MKEQIIGNWTEVHEYCEFPNDDMIDRKEYYPNSIYTFSPDGTFVNKFENGAYQEGEWSINGDEITIKYERMFDQYGKIVDNDLLRYEEKGKVKKVTSSEMKLDMTMIANDGDKGYSKKDFVRK